MSTRVAPRTRPDTAPHRAQRTGAVVVTVVSGLIAVVLIAAFVGWSNQYLPVVYNADETSTSAHFAPGFIATGALEAGGLVLAATIALIAGLIVASGEKAYRLGITGQLLRVAAAACVAAAIPVGILYAFFAVVPLFFAGVAVAGIAVIDGRRKSSS
jgi:hypothetical protein